MITDFAAAALSLRRFLVFTSVSTNFPRVYLLLIDFYMHLHRYMLKATIISLSQILNVVVANNQVNLTVEPIKDVCPLCGAS